MNAPTWKKIAHLACLGLNDADLPHITSALNSILGLVDEMQAVNTDGIEPLAHPLEASQRLRADVVTETNHREAYQSIAPAVEKRPVSGSESHRLKGKSLQCIN